MLVNGKRILKAAQKGRYAVGAFNTSNLEITQSIFLAAHNLKSPVIIATSPKAIVYAGGADVLAKIIMTVAKRYQVVYALHLDHATDIATVKECLRAGYSSIMFDGSRLSFKENLRLTKQAVNLAHKQGVSVEGEIGTIGGKEDYLAHKKIILATPEQASEFAAKTGVDFLAAAVGTAHGVERQSGQEKINFDTLRVISGSVGLPLVLHGASEGVGDSDIKKAITLGICKINIDTNLRRGFSQAIRDLFDRDKLIYDPREIMTVAKTAMQKVVEERIRLFGSANRRV